MAPQHIQFGDNPATPRIPSTLWDVDDKIRWYGIMSHSLSPFGTCLLCSLILPQASVSSQASLCLTWHCYFLRPPVLTHLTSLENMVWALKKDQAFTRSLPPRDELEQVSENYQHKMTCHWFWPYHLSQWCLTCSGADCGSVRQMDNTKLLTLLFFSICEGLLLKETSLTATSCRVPLATAHPSGFHELFGQPPSL